MIRTVRKRFSVLCLCLFLLLHCCPAVFAEEKKDAETETVVLHNTEEFLLFAQNCAYDLYSAGRSFELAADINLSGTEFSPVPYFAGTFDGKQHTVSGVFFHQDGSRQGLFRVVAEGAEIRNLHVSGSLSPEGTASFIGGIAGVNSGLLSGCSFDGSVSGVENIGGVVGHNTLKGKVSGCSFSGSVTAEHQAGGIAGLNDGSLSECVSHGDVNTVAVTPREQPRDQFLSGGFDISQFSEDDFLNLSNIGGIAGISTGIVENCRNEGGVGYYSTAYNVGGIVGRSSGFVSGCVNTGEVNGRRDVGGIVGQLIPFTDWDLSSGKLDALSWQISILNGQLNSLNSHVSDLSSTMIDSLNNLQWYTADMTSALQSIMAESTGNDQIIIDSIHVDPETGSISFTYPEIGNVDNSALSDALTNLYAESSIVMDLARESSGTLASDLRSVAGQIGNVFDTLFSTVSDLSNVGVETDDLSESEAYVRNTGAVAGCLNQGSVLAETNAGGILGTSSFEIEYDMEDRLNASDYLTTYARQNLFAVVRDCSCVCETEARSGTAGGIVGDMAIGAVAGCIALGSVSALNSDYVGGVAGSSSGSVFNCWARSLLHGGKYIGGIAGLGTNIRDCRAWPHFERQKEYAGAVAGWAEGTVSGNYYVSCTPGGVDGISLGGQTDGLSEASFLTLEGLPEQFGTVTVQYVAEGKKIAEETVSFGGTLRQIPEVENSGGRYWQWDLPESEHIFTSLTVTGAYHAPATTLASAEDPPRFLVEGQFYEGQVLQFPEAAAPASEEAITGEELIRTAVLVNDYEGDLTVRMLTATDGTVWVWEEGTEPVTVPAARDGSYLVFTLPNGASFCETANAVQAGVAGLSVSTWIALAVLLLLILLLPFLILSKRRKRARAKAE